MVLVKHMNIYFVEAEKCMDGHFGAENDKGGHGNGNSCVDIGAPFPMESVGEGSLG
jgi:hypothetical protein